MIILANQSHAQIISEILIDSIKYEAINYYDNDPEVLTFWLNHKSPESIELQLKKTDTKHYIININNKIIGVGSILEKGAF